MTTWVKVDDERKKEHGLRDLKSRELGIKELKYPKVKSVNPRPPVLLKGTISIIIMHYYA